MGDQISDILIKIEKFYSKNKMPSNLNKLAPQLNLIFTLVILLVFSIFGTPKILIPSSDDLYFIYWIFIIAYGVIVIVLLLFVNFIIIPRFREIFPNGELKGIMIYSFALTITCGPQMIISIFIALIIGNTINYYVWGVYFLGVSIMIYLHLKMNPTLKDQIDNPKLNQV